MSLFRTRRSFLAGSAAVALAGAARGQAALSARANVAELDRDTILSQAKQALAQAVVPPPSPAFHTEVEPNPTTAGASASPKLRREDALALQTFSATLAALTAGFLITPDPMYADRARAWLQVWLLDARSRLQPQFDTAGCAAGGTAGTPAGVLDLVPLAELARALSFLTDALPPADLEQIQAWLGDALHWLGDNRQARIAQDTKDHRASAHLLVSSAAARFLRNDAVLEDCRKRFRTHTLRNQVRADGVFPQEVATPNPYRNTLLNFDMLAGACQLLSSAFDPLWEHELVDGVGMRIVAAYLYPVISHPERWGYPADA
jgi:hypothetical protein